MAELNKIVVAIEPGDALRGSVRTRAPPSGRSSAGWACSRRCRRRSASTGKPNEIRVHSRLHAAAALVRRRALAPAADAAKRSDLSCGRARAVIRRRARAGGEVTTTIRTAAPGRRRRRRWASRVRGIGRLGKGDKRLLGMLKVKELCKGKSVERRVTRSCRVRSSPAHTSSPPARTRRRRPGRATSATTARPPPARSAFARPRLRSGSRRGSRPTGPSPVRSRRAAAASARSGPTGPPTR